MNVRNLSLIALGGFALAAAACSPSTGSDASGYEPWEQIENNENAGGATCQGVESRPFATSGQPAERSMAERMLVSKVDSLGDSSLKESDYTVKCEKLNQRTGFYYTCSAFKYFETEGNWVTKELTAEAITVAMAKDLVEKEYEAFLNDFEGPVEKIHDASVDTLRRNSDARDKNEIGYTAKITVKIPGCSEGKVVE